MRCQEVGSLTKNYYSGSIDEFTRIKIHHHLAGCKSCTEEFDMWSRGEEYMRSSSSHSTGSKSQTTSAVMNSVMGRIQQEEKWANPSFQQTKSYSKSTKTLVSFVGSMLLIVFVLFFATTLSPQTELVADHPVVEVEMLEGSWDLNKIVLREHGPGEETSMSFQVVASLGDPIIYTLPTEERKIPFGIILSVFGFLCIILGMSWITRV
jgi:hypothetical protein